MDSDSAYLKEFLLCYEKQRCLWDTAHPGYTRRDERNESYKTLSKIMEKYNKPSSLYDVRKKINTIRSSYKRELRKIMQSEACGDDNLYQPKIWWYDYCKFLTTTDKHSQGMSPATTLSDDEDTNLHDTNSSHCSNDTLDEIQTIFYDLTNDEVYLNEPPKKIKKIIEEKVDAQNIVKNILHQDVDSNDLMSLAWAKKLRKMKPLQSKLAERLIAEIIFQGEMDMLTTNTAIHSNQMKLSTTGRSTSREESPDKHVATTVIKAEPTSEEITVEEYSVTSYNFENDM
ncbi:uncharacterized protein [Musca autumnalis]|uniref:uncharacterized protein n=1 Tax=Musca autumnalis TaxID=221902 RepID=UPI003CEF2E21